MGLASTLIALILLLNGTDEAHHPPRELIHGAFSAEPERLYIGCTSL